MQHKLRDGTPKKPRSTKDFSEECRPSSTTKFQILFLSLSAHHPERNKTKSQHVNCQQKSLKRLHCTNNEMTSKQTRRDGLWRFRAEISESGMTPPEPLVHPHTARDPKITSFGPKSLIGSKSVQNRFEIGSAPSPKVEIGSKSGQGGGWNLKKT
eukprot:4748299-Amphidinium_carterae.1